MENKDMSYWNGYREGYLKALEEFSIPETFKRVMTPQLVLNFSDEEKEKFLKEWGDK